MNLSLRLIFFFFFQAEDGIRDYKVTGVQTCALPIYETSDADGARRAGRRQYPLAFANVSGRTDAMVENERALQLGYRFEVTALLDQRSEERRVGKECRSRV